MSEKTSKGHGTTSSWKKMMDLQIFVSYSQRTNACFRYLDLSCTGSFSLKDFTDRGKFVISYLNLDSESKSKFPIMDIFRNFDRSGDDRVDLYEFVVGVMERLQALSQNIPLLEAISDEVLSLRAESINEISEVMSKLTDEDFKHGLPRYWASFGSLHYLMLEVLQLRL